MKNSVGNVPFRSSDLIGPSARLRYLPNTTSLAVLVILGALASGAGSANTDAGQGDAPDERALTRVAESASCARYGINRLVELRASDDGEAPCEVAYLKPDEDGSTTSLWRARNDYGYCVVKFSEFISKLENKLAWDCGQDGDRGAAVSNATAKAPDVSQVMVDTGTASKADAAAVPEVSAVTAEVAQSEVAAPVVTASESTEVVEKVGDEAAGFSEQASLAVPQSTFQRPEPALSAALVTTRLENDGPGAAVSMDDVRSRIPSGPYESIIPEGIDVSVCPPGGSFFWNTRNPDQPVFEMGQDAEFTFSTARGRVGQGFALQAEPALQVESDDPSEYRVASLSVVGVGTVEARILIEESNEGPTANQSGSICQYRLGGG